MPIVLLIILAIVIALVVISILVIEFVPLFKRIPIRIPIQIGSALIFLGAVLFIILSIRKIDLLSIIILVLSLGYIIYIVIEKIYVLNLRKKFKYIIHVNGIRGKSTTTRLIDAGMRGCGYKVFSKTTGTIPSYIDVNNQDQVIKRLGSANIREQIKMMWLANKEKAEVLVLECMAVNPELQEVCEKQILNADVCVITNVRPDHIQEMGNNLEEIAEAFCLTIPQNGVVVLGKNDFMATFKKAAYKRGSKIEPLIEYPEADLLDTFKENLDIALTVGKALNCDLPSYIEGMKQYHHDFGAFEEIHYQKTTLLNGFSINDPISIRMVYDEIAKKYDVETMTILLNSRIDRPTRAEQHIELLQTLPCQKVLLMGANVKYIERHLKAQLPDKTIKIITHIEELLDEEVVFGIGNIGGKGMEILDYFRRHGENNDR